VEPGLLSPPLPAQAVLAHLSEGPALAADLARLEQVNPIYDALHAAYAREPDPDRRRILAVNRTRARGLPQRLPSEYLLVDIPAQTLEIWAGGGLAETISVAVGRRDMPTPALAGRLRFLVLNPYWHVPLDVAAKTFAPIAVRAGPDALAARGFEVRTGFDAQAETRSPDGVDWAAVAQGREAVYLRQKPGPDNAMGSVKFIFPNSLGIYLHDTPARKIFDQDRRLVSAGCVRLSDAAALIGRLTGSSLQDLDRGVPEQRVELARPLPIYLLYLTARPTRRGIVYQPDIYNWDRNSPPRLRI
jgi:murein L,D-transpeptidase YcbB/YkuD